MQSYQCPNCGRIYNYGDFNDRGIMLQCMNCRYPLKKIEEVKTVKHPELNPMLSDYHVIGEVSNSNKPQVTCPYCHSTNTKKISTTAKVVNTALFGIFGTKRYKQWHCNHCNSDF